jgi:hypothetical protein
MKIDWEKHTREEWFCAGLVVGALEATIVLSLFFTTGCAPARAMYCEQRSADGKHCIVWAKHRYPCVSRPDGSCTPETR